MVQHLICCCGWNNSNSLFVEWSRIVVHQCYWMCPGPMCWSVVTCVIRCHSNISQSQDTGQRSSGARGGHSTVVQLQCLPGPRSLVTVRVPGVSCGIIIECLVLVLVVGAGVLATVRLWSWVECQTVNAWDAAISFWEINNFKGTIRVSTTDTVPYHIYLIEQIFYQLHSQTLNSHQLFVGISSLGREIISRRCDKKQMEFQLLIWKSMLGAPTSIRTRASKPFQCQKWWIGLEKKQVRAFKM